MGTKKGHIYGNGPPFKEVPQRFGGEQLPQTSPLDLPLLFWKAFCRREIQRYLRLNDI